MKYLSVCSGIEAATVAWHPLGWRPAAFAEIEPFPSAVLAHHYPDVPNLGDMTRFQEWPDVRPDLLVGGTPCQSFSVAGLRRGLADPRGNLALTFLAVLDRYRPRWVVWENVPGVRSSGGGRDFGAFLGGLGELGYGWAYRSLDAQYFGLAQRRERVFVVGRLGEWAAPAAVLFEPACLSGHPPPRREAGERASPTLDGRAGRSGETGFHTSGGLTPFHVALTLESRAGAGGGGWGTDFLAGGGLVPELANPLTAYRMLAFGEYASDGTDSTMKSRDGKDATDLVVAHALRAEGFDASEGGTGRRVPLVPHLAIDLQQVTSKANRTRPSAESPPLMANGRVVAFAIQERAVCENPDAGPDGAGFRSDGTAYTLEARTVPQAVAFAPQAGGTQTTIGYDPQRGTSPTLGAHQIPAIASPVAVRRLTPRECERLQGFPDDYTLIPYRGKPAADGPRYRALGNSMAVPVMRWIGQRIAAVETADGPTA